MHLHSLSILNYKNISQTDLTFSPNLNCLIGANGEGKTNLLDAIYFLSFCRSAFCPNNQQVVRHEQDTMMIQGVYHTNDDEELNIYCGLRLGHRKSFKKNGKEYNKLSQHIGLIPLVITSPSDSELIIGSSESRRKFLDTTISQYSPSYLQCLITYNQVLQQRNALLKASPDEPDKDLLTAYDQALSVPAAKIFQERNEFVEQFIPIFNHVYSLLGNKDELVGIEYKSDLKETPSLFDLLQSHHQKDYIIGHTLKGIHLDNLIMTLNGHPLRYEGSQGQSKTYLIALRLAQYTMLQQANPERTPLLLLDDIFDKLDPQRVQRIIEIVSSPNYGQTFITTTTNSHLTQIIQQATKDHKIFNVVNGTYEAN